MAVAAQTVREQVAWACRILAAAGYADLTLGHVSCRPDDGQIVHIKRKGVALGEVLPDDVTEFDLADGTPSGPGMHLEAVLHSEVYRLRPDVGAVVHGHPPHATAFGATDAELELLTHDAVLFAEGLAAFDGTPDLIVDAEQGRAVAIALGSKQALLLRNHGVLVTGKDVAWAVLTAVTLERAARLQSIASTLGALKPIPPEIARQMRAGKYRDGFVREYWDAWVRQLRRAGADGGMPA